MCFFFIGNSANHVKLYTFLINKSLTDVDVMGSSTHAKVSVCTQELVLSSIRLDEIVV